MGIVKEHDFIYTMKELDPVLRGNRDLDGYVIQGLDFSDVDIDWEKIKVGGAIFLGCVFSNKLDPMKLWENGAHVVPRFDDIPYRPFRSNLYTWRELMEGYESGGEKGLDHVIYTHFIEKGGYNPGIREALTQRIHDHSIDNALGKYLSYDEHNMIHKKAVGFMGGHKRHRGDDDYNKVVRTAWLAAREGYFVVSGGGPGIMEAANLGAYMARYEEKDLEKAIAILAEATDFNKDEYITQAVKVLDKYPDGTANLAIPTWFYGQEPSNMFASAIAKYFSNSIREDKLLAICLYGIVYAVGSAGTTQEIFMDATQNHYGTFGYYSPMVFLGKRRYREETSIFPLLKQLANGKLYEKMLHLTDSPDEVVRFIGENPPIKVSDE